jgi:hypothetical protein
LVSGDIVDREPESPELIIPGAEKGFSQHIGIEATDVQLLLFLLWLTPTPFSRSGVPVPQ